ncbi:MAG: SWIM zinc finger family protein [Candidatus Hadarchaeales archaeon]
MAKVTLEQLLEIRRQRAEEALQGGQYTIKLKEKEPGKGTWVWEVRNGEGETYTITYTKNGDAGTWACTCPDFQKHRIQGFRCKHTFMVEMVELSRKSRKTQADTDPGAVVIHWGQHKGKTLSQIASEKPGFLAWLAFRMEPKTEEDRKLQEAARRVYEKKPKKGGKGDPMAEFIALAGVELLRQVWKAQENGEKLDDPLLGRYIELRLEAIKLVKSKLEAIAG